MHQIVFDNYTPSPSRRGVSAPPIVPRWRPASAGIIDARNPSYAAPIASGAMHMDFVSAYLSRASEARVTITQARRLPARLNHSIRPESERAGREPARSQYDYMLYLDGALAGTIEVIELEVGLAFVGWVGIKPHARGLGLGAALHRRVLEDFGALAVEDFCSPDEQYTLVALHRSGHRITKRRNQAHLRIIRGCRVVECMYVVERLPPAISADPQSPDTSDVPVS